MVKTRTNQAKDLSLFSRGKKAKGCDLFLSLHSKPAEKDDLYRVRVTIDDLNIRTGPGTKYASKGYIEPGVYRIVKEDGIWLKLYSGEGWISSKYAKRLNE